MIKNYLKTKLIDDFTDRGGISFVGETVEDFLADTDLTENDTVEELNKELQECGIEPIVTFDMFKNNTKLVLDTFEYDIENELNLVDTLKTRGEYLYDYYLNNKKEIDFITYKEDYVIVIDNPSFLGVKEITVKEAMELLNNDHVRNIEELMELLNNERLFVLEVLY